MISALTGGRFLFGLGYTAELITAVDGRPGRLELSFETAEEQARFNAAAKEALRAYDAKQARARRRQRDGLEKRQPHSEKLVHYEIRMLAEKLEWGAEELAQALREWDGDRAGLVQSLRSQLQCAATTPRTPRAVLARALSDRQRSVRNLFADFEIAEQCEELKADAELQRVNAELEAYKSPRKPLQISTPRPTVPSCVLTSESKRQMIVGALPPVLQVYEWRLLYQLSRHGASLSNLLRHAARAAPSLLIIRTLEKNTVVGGLAVRPWKTDGCWTGTGQSFVFTFAGGFHCYKWSRVGNLFQMSSQEALAIGGDGGYAIRVDNALLQVTCAQCDTFGNPNLLGADGVTVQTVAELELWTFDL